ADGVLFDGNLELKKEGNYWVSQEFSFDHVRLWDHGSPELYRVELTVLDEKGEVTEFIPYETGFRRFELRNKVLYLNGNRLMLNGVNRHEWNPHTGRAITLADMEK